MITSMECAAVTPAKLKEASQTFRICLKVLEILKSYMRILLPVQISFVDPVVGKPIIELRGDFTSLEVDVNVK